MLPDEQMQIDFGDETLNDPQYEEKVQDDGTLGEPPIESTTEQDGNSGTVETKQAPKPDGAQAGESSATDSTGQQEPQQPAGRTRADKDGNLVDDKGNIVAAAGPERRAFERVQAQDRYIKKLEGELEDVRKSSDFTNALNGAPAKLGLSPQDTEIGLQAIASFKKDPVSTARWMLQETMRLGYDLKQIIGGDAQGQLNGGSLDLAAIKSMISDAVSPLVSDREAQQQQTRAQQEAQREYDRFMANHDHASVHEDAITALVSQDTNTTPEVAYWRLREYAAANGLDFSKPLGPQVQARQQGEAPNGNATPQAQTHQQQQPMPNGAAPPQQDMQTGPTMANPDDAWDTIVNQSLREAGMLQ